MPLYSYTYYIFLLLQGWGSLLIQTIIHEITKGLRNSALIYPVIKEISRVFMELFM